MRKKYFKTMESAGKVLNQIQEQCNIFLCLQYDENKQLYFIEY